MVDHYRYAADAWAGAWGAPNSSSDPPRAKRSIRGSIIMAELNRDLIGVPFGGRVSHAEAAAIDAGLRAYMLRIYNYMSIGLAITGFAALGVYMAAVTTDPSAPRPRSAMLS